MKASEKILLRAQELYGRRLNTIMAACRVAAIDEATQRFESHSAEMAAILEYLDAMVPPLRVVCSPQVSLSEREALRKLGATLLPEGCRPLMAGEDGPILGPIRASARLPEPEIRVLAFVPSESPGYRWRVAYWCAPPAQYTERYWRDDASEVGDSTIHWKPDQVTHWMPLPEEPK